MWYIDTKHRIFWRSPGIRMAGSLFTTCFALLFLGLGIVCGEPDDEVRLSEASVLLPYSTKVNYQIQALNGCFRWYASEITC